MARVILINGILTHGEGNVDVLGARLAARGYQVEDTWHEKVNPITARWRGISIARSKANWIEDGDIIVAHSFGCVITRHLLHMVDVDVAGAYLIAPADGERKSWEDAQVRTVFCYHSPEDWTVRLGSWLWFHVFGSAGLNGYEDERVVNVEMESDHNDYFKSPLVEEIERDILANHPL